MLIAVILGVEVVLTLIIIRVFHQMECDTEDAFEKAVDNCDASGKDK